MTQRLKELVAEWRMVHEQLLKLQSIDCELLKHCAEQVEAVIAPQWQPAPVPICDTIESYWVATEDRAVYLAHWIKRFPPGCQTSKFMLVDDYGMLITKPITHFMPAEFPEPPGGVG